MLRVGSVPYLVGRPLDLGLEGVAGIELVRDVPARLVRGLREGSIDVALVSSVELFRQPGYGYLSGIAVAGHDYVASVQVFLRRPLEEVRTIALDPASRTARALTQVAWPREASRAPSFLEVPEGVDPRSVEADGWLRIGDRALEELAEDPERPHWNPSEAWRRQTGLPFVFAPWIVRAGVDPSPWAEAFVAAWRFGTTRLRELADEEAAATGLDPSYLRRYLEQECLYAPGEAMHASLSTWHERASAMGLADPAFVPRALPLPGGP